jgi:DNA ligase-1
MEKEIKKENFCELFGKDAKEKIRVWRIWSEDNFIFMETGLLDGEKIIFDEEVEEGLASRTLEEQILSRINSRINKKIDSGYLKSLEDAKNNVRTNSLGFKKPAKCSRYDQQKNKIPYDKTFVQPKLDGHHCNIICDSGVNIAYSSNGKIIDSIPELLANIKLKEGELVEGELYCHGVPLQTISSWVKKKQKESEQLRFYAYDYASEECYSKRLERLKEIDFGYQAEVLETDLFYGKFYVDKLLEERIQQGYEGLVLRLLNFPHESGKRSKGLIKVKPMHFGEFKIDDEFLVVDIISSKDGWAILVCETEEGKQFKVSCHGTFEYKTEVYQNRDDYFGKHIRIEYAGLTKDKKPFHPVAICWREKFEE